MPPAFARTQAQVLLGIMAGYLFFYTGRQNLGFAVKGMQSDLGYTATEIAWLNAALLIGYGVGQSINGNLADMVSRRRMVAVGSVLTVALNWIFSLVSTPLLAAGLWFANGMAQSAVSPALRRLIVDWYPQSDRGRAVGFHLLSAGFSSSLTFALCIATLSALDWRWIFRLPVATVALGAIVFLTLVHDHPTRAGFPALPPDPSEPPSSAAETSWQRYRTVLRNRHFLLACLSIGFESMARYGLLSWVPLHFLRTAKGSAADLWVTLGLPIGMAIGALSAGLFTDRWFPHRRAHVASALMAGAAVFTFLLSQTPTQSPFSFALLGLAGFLVYAPQASYWALGPVLVGRERSGTATGIMDSTAYAFAAMGQVIIGRTIDATGSTFPVFAVIAGACLLGALVILPVRK
jgi:MFS transporter, OPA family, glycerol-3-phosphate transporter